MNNYSIPWNKSLRFRLLVSPLVVALLMGIVLISFISYMSKQRVEREYKDKGASCARTVAQLINSDMVDRYLSTLETDDEYFVILNHLRTIQRENALQYVYVVRMLENGQVFVFDSDTKTGYELGKADGWARLIGEGNEDYAAALFRGERVEPLICNTIFGYMMQSYAPILRDDGSIAAYAGVDISMSQLMREQTNLFIVLGVVTILIFALTISINIFISQRYVISPIRILVDKAGSFLTEKSEFTKESLLRTRLKSGNELAVLEHSIMEMALRIGAEMSERLKAAETFRVETEKHASILKSILNGLDSYIMVSDMDTDEILFLNQKVITDYGFKGTVIGDKCWQHIHSGMKTRCDFCRKGELLQNPDKPVIREVNNEVLNKDLIVIDRLIDWSGERQAHMQQALDVSAVKKAQMETEYYAKMTRVLNDTAIMLLSQREETFEETMTHGIGAVVNILDLDRVSVWRNKLKPDGMYGGQVFRWDKDDGGTTPTSKQFVEVKVDDWVPRWKKVLSSGEAINGPVRLLPEAALLKSFGCVSVFISPVIAEGEFWGYVMFEDKTRERVFTKDEASILRSTSLMISSAVTRQEEAIQIRRADKRLKLMLNATPLACQIISRNFVAIDCNEAAIKLFGFKNKQEYVEKWSIEHFSPEYQPDGQLSIEKANVLIKKAFEQGSCVFEWTHQLLDGVSIPTEVNLVRVEYENSNVIAAYIHDLRVIRLLETKAEKIYIDPLTGIHNRRFLDENLKRAMDSLSRSGSLLSLMMIDIDHFKKYNDTYGHDSGDACLTTIAKTLAKSPSRADDFVVRYGGEEFAVVLPNTDERGARLLANKLLKNVRNCNIPHESSDTADHVTISIGVTTGKVEHTQSVSMYVKRADEMLYKSKQDGRNRYSFQSMEKTS